jgi:hypothetical protein
MSETSIHEQLDDVQKALILIRDEQRRMFALLRTLVAALPPSTLSP